MATAAGQGKWEPAKHLLAIDRAVTSLILDSRRGTATANILAIEAPPRHGKSEFVSKNLPAWFLGRWPDRRVMLASYEATFARSWGRKARTILEEHGQELFGVSISSEQQAAVDWEIAEHRGGMVTAGVGGPMTGRGADLLIIDDPVKNAEEAMSETVRASHWDWWQSTASTRIEPGGCAIVMATRWHEDDLTGRLLKAAANGEGAAVRRLRLPAIAEEGDELGRLPGEELWPERWPLKLLKQREKSLDPYWWLALYQQQPVGDRFAEWPAEYFGDHVWFDDWPSPADTVMKVMAIDPSLGQTDKSDYSAIIALAKDIHGTFWIDANLERRPSARIVKDALAIHRQFMPVALGCETNQFQALLRDQFEGESIKQGQSVWFCGCNNTVPKVIRVRSLTPLLAQRRIRFRRGSAGVNLLIEQARGFPLAKYDDGPDALEMAVRLCEELLRGSVTEEPVTEGQVYA